MKRIGKIIMISVILVLAVSHTHLTQAAPAKKETDRVVITEISNTQEGIFLCWKKIRGADGYAIFRDGSLIKRIGPDEEREYLDRKARENGKKYRYRVCAVKKDNKKISYENLSRLRGQYYLEKNEFATVSRRGERTDFSWTKNKKATGYQIAYSTDEGKEKVRYLKISDKKKTEYATKKLNRKKTYCVWIRSFRKGKAVTSFSEWSRMCKVIAFDSGWKYADSSIIHSDSVTLYTADEKNKKGKTVCINAGHGTSGGERVKTYCHPDRTPKVTGGSTPRGALKAAAVSGGTRMADGSPESEATLAVALTVKQTLLEEGYDVLMIRDTSDIQLDNVGRTVMANQNADCHIAIHYDGSQSNKGAFYIGVPNIASYRAMDPVSKNWKKHDRLGEELVAGMKKSGVKILGSGCMRIDLTQTSYSTVPSVDLEVGDRITDRSAKERKRIAKGIASGLDAFFVIKSTGKKK